MHLGDGVMDILETIKTIQTMIEKADTNESLKELTNSDFDALADSIDALSLYADENMTELNRNSGYLLD